MKTLQRAFNFLFADDGTFDDRLARARGEFAGEAPVENMLAFASAKTRFPLCQPKRLPDGGWRRRQTRHPWPGSGTLPTRLAESCERHGH